MHPRIVVDPEICHGKPVIKGTRVLVSNILGSLAAGQTHDQIIEDYPSIAEEDIIAALQYASFLSSFETRSYDSTLK